MKLHKIETGNLKLDGGAMFGVVPKVIWNKLYPSDENNLCNWSMRCLLIETDDRKILIDTGIGEKQDVKFLRHYYLNGEDSLQKSLKKAGVHFNEITDVILTHLHFDHAGGAVKNENDRLVCAFPNATYHISKAQWEWATNPNRREKASFLKENILPIKQNGQLNLVEDEGELIPGIELLIFHGHTDGQIIPLITLSENKKLAYMGDLLPSVAHIPMPYVMSYDTKPLVTLKDKERFFEKAINENITLFFEHDIYNECCSLIQTPKGIRADKVFTLNEFLNN